MPDPQTEEAKEADDMGEKPDLGRTPDALLTEAMSGTDSGSDTRAGSLEGGAATGSEIDPDQDAINATLASEGMASADPQSPSDTAADLEGPAGDPAEGKRDDDVDAATG